jgi:hemerythrin-like domain-containing protein
MNIIDKLENDHEEVRAIMAELTLLLNSNDDSDKKQELFDKFKEAYSKHTKIEENIVYPAFEKYPELQKLARKGYQAHHVVDVGLLELKLWPFSSDSWEPKFSVIQDSILTHMEEEENMLFEEARDIVDETELVKLREQAEEV